VIEARSMREYCSTFVHLHTVSLEDADQGRGLADPGVMLLLDALSLPALDIGMDLNRPYLWTLPMA